MPINLKPEERSLAISSIEQYFRSEMQTPIGNMEAAALLNFFLEDIAPAVYNRAIADAQENLQARVLELDVELHESGFTYWNKGAKSRK
jgi:uncharacterized protein (DUF2164 family)